MFTEVSLFFTYALRRSLFINPESHSGISWRPRVLIRSQVVGEVTFNKLLYEILRLILSR